MSIALWRLVQCFNGRLLHLVYYNGKRTGWVGARAHPLLSLVYHLHVARLVVVSCL